LTNFDFVSKKRGENKKGQFRKTGNKVQKIQNEEKKAKNKTKNKKTPPKKTKQKQKTKNTHNTEK
jgi:hypothetical protein